MLQSIQLQTITAKQTERQAHYNEKPRPRKAGIQNGLNKEIKRILREEHSGWVPEAPVFEPDEETGAGFWTMDFHKHVPELRHGVGVEVTFNHAEAMTWTLVRPTLAYQAEGVIPESRIDVAAIIVGTRNLKGVGEPKLRMDSSVVTYERLRTLLPRLKWVLPAPMVFFALDWADGGQVGQVDEIDLYKLSSGLKFPDADPLVVRTLAKLTPSEERVSGASSPPETKG